MANTTETVVPPPPRRRSVAVGVATLIPSALPRRREARLLLETVSLHVLHRERERERESRHHKDTSRSSRRVIIRGHIEEAGEVTVGSQDESEYGPGT